MAQEEKAKAYDEAMERVKAIYYQGSYKPDIAATIAETLQNIFPELKESEDERMKETCKFYLNLQKVNSPHSVSDIDKCIAWLEKQGKPFYPKKDVDDAYLKGISDAKKIKLEE